MPMMGGPMGKEGMRGAMGHHGWMHRGEEHQGGGAVFAFRRGDQNIFIRCAEDEPMRACVDAASRLINAVKAGGRPWHPKGAPGGGPNSGAGMSSPGSPSASPPGSSSGTTPGSSSGSGTGTGASKP
jgi:hypothetical protein